MNIPPVESIADDAQAAVRWDAFSLWEVAPGDEGRIYEQDVLLMAPDGSLAGHSTRQFSMTGRLHRVISTTWGFPVGQPGRYTLVLKLKDVAAPDQFILEIDYPMWVSHQKKPD